MKVVKKEHIYIGLGFMLFLFGCMKYNDQPLLPKQGFSQNENIKNTQEPSQERNQNLTDTAIDAAIASLSAKNVTSEEVKNLQEFSELLLEFGFANKSMGELQNYLDNAGYAPKLSDQTRPYFIRAAAPPDGIRYIHAQYFEDFGKGAYLQHLSFEFRPGPGSFEIVDSVIEQALKKYGLENSSFQEGSGVKDWKLSNGMHLYIQRLEESDLRQVHPYNAYGPSDIGTVRIAIEIDESHEGHAHGVGSQPLSSGQGHSH